MRKIKDKDQLIILMKDGWTLGCYSGERYVVQKGNLGYGGPVKEVDTALVREMDHDLMFTSQRQGYLVTFKLEKE